MATDRTARRKAQDAAYHAAHRETRNAYHRAYHAANRAKLSANAKLYRRTHRDELKAYERTRRCYINDLKSGPCMDCGGTFPPECMDFDHRDPAAKVSNVAAMVKADPAVLAAEVAKCDLVCANCHRTRTKRRRASSG